MAGDAHRVPRWTTHLPRSRSRCLRCAARLVRGAWPAARVPAASRAMGRAGVGGDGPADADRAGGAGLGRVHGAYPTPAALAAARPPRCSARGPGWATTAGRSTSSVPRRHRGAARRRAAAHARRAGGAAGGRAYTARAVAAIAFGVPVAAVDTNVRRVVGRLVAGHGGGRRPGRAAAARASSRRWRTRWWTRPTRRAGRTP